MKKNSTSKSQSETEIALQESERKFRETVTYLDEGYYSVTIDGLLLDHNQAFNRILGFEIDQDLKGVKLPDFWQNPDERKVYLQELMTMGFIRNYLINAKTIGGEKIAVMANSHLVKDEKGGLVRIEGTYNDFTERIRAEKALSEAELKFRTIFDKASDGMLLTENGSSTFYIANNKICEMLGYTQKEILKIGLSDIHLKKDLPYVIEQFARLMRNEISLAADIPVLRKDGTIFYADINSSSVTLGGKDYLIGVFRDITERKLAEEKLSLLASRQDAILSSVHDIIMEVDNDKVYTWANQSGIEFFGDDVIGKEAGLFFEGEQETYQIVKPLFDGSENNIYIESWQRRQDGEKRLLAWWCRVLKDERGNVIGALSSALDITERILAETQIRKLNEELELRVIQRTEQLEAANKELEAFSYSVSHDLRAPLRSVHGYTKILLEDYEQILDDEGKRICGIISSSATQMGELIDDLLNFSRIGRSGMNPSLVDMKSLVGSVFREFTSEKEKLKIDFKIGKLHKANADVNLIRLVWNNLISNAIKYSSKNPLSEISIGSILNGDSITYFVKDNGVGFDMQYEDKLFGVFQRLHSGNEFEGNGVGLAIIKRIILKHNGRVWAEGDVGKGATFYFSLPAEEGNMQ